MTDLPHVLALTPTDRATYQDGLVAAGLRPRPRSLSERMQLTPKGPIPYGNPIVLPRSVAREMAQACGDLWGAHYELMGRDGVTQWINQHGAPVIRHSDGSASALNNPDVNRQLERRLTSSWHSPYMQYDCVVARDAHGRPALRLVEAQSAVAYAGWMDVINKARKDDERPYDRSLGIGPTRALRRLRHAFDGPVIVLDMPPVVGNSVLGLDRLHAARTLGDDTSRPVSPLDIRKDADGWYCGSAGKRRPIRSVLSRMTQVDLDAMCVAADDSQLALLVDFFNDASLQWMHHPAWQYIVTKATLSTIAASSSDGAFRRHLIPTHSPGDVVQTPGNYFLKPKDGNSGYGVRPMSIRPNDRFVVPDGHLLQERFTPYAIPTPDASQHMREGLPLGLRCGLLEIRVMYSPRLRGDLAGAWFMTRFGPYFHPDLTTGKSRVTWTNTLLIRDAMKAYELPDLDPDELAFGAGPALIERSAASIEPRGTTLSRELVPLEF